jgi:hypothetical protein
VTKVILGTFGCLPACDQYFVPGFRHEGFSYSEVNAVFVGQVLQFCREHLDDLREEQASIKRDCGIEYPLMKLV